MALLGFADMFALCVLLNLVVPCTKPVMACIRIQKICLKHGITVDQRFPIESYKKTYEESKTKWVQPQPIGTNIKQGLNESVSSCIGCGTVAANTYDSIIQGNVARDKLYPWQVHIRGKSSYCGGVLISSQWVLTAAHCIRDTRYIILGTTNLTKGVTNGVFRIPEKEIIHKDYMFGHNDIALIKMTQPVVFNDYIRPACIPKDGEDFMSTKCHVTGWGLTDYEHSTVPLLLQETRATIMNQLECIMRLIPVRFMVSPGHICTKINKENPDSGVCLGDSGGPLSCLIGGIYYVAGVVSTTQQSCKKYFVPDVYTRVSYFRNWIIEKITQH